jgi:signal transduction histidine kinase/FixJ family two-component response regulator
MEFSSTPHPLVFVLDDEPGIILLCKRLLERAGFQAASFSAPTDALTALEGNPADLLLVDIRMPELDGFQVIDRARQLHPDRAVVVMTGYGTVETAIEALRRGADGLILKPFRGNELVQTVQRALEQSRHKQDQIRLQALRPLFDITEALFTETNPKRLQTLILNAVCGHLQCSHAEYYQFSPSDGVDPLSDKSRRMRLVGSLHYPGRKIQPEVRPTTALSNEPLARRANTLRIPFLIQVDGPGESQLQEVLADRGLGSALCAQVSLKTGAGVGGVLIAARDQNEPRFRLADLDMFVIFARQAAVAFENARLHAELRAYIRQLEDSQRALIQAEKMAIAGRLTTSIAHEINNPLQAVQNCLHLAGRIQLPAEQRQNYLQLACTELDRLMITVQRMLDFYRPAALDRKPVDINHLIQKVLSLLEQQLADHQVTIHSRFNSQLPPIMAVSDQLQQVILNLILNAVEAMPGGGSIQIETSLNSTNPGEVEALFQDTGPGIPPSQRKHLFEPFVSTKEHGTGLGLTVSYGIITAHGGSLDLVDRPKFNTQKGACFRITLPIAEHT